MGHRTRPNQPSMAVDFMKGCSEQVLENASDLAEREGFEPSVQVLARTTV